MVLDLFYSNKNKNGLKQILLENNKNFNQSKLDNMINDTMKYVSSNVNKTPPNGMSQNDYLILMNKKVYDLISPIIKTNNNNSNIKQTLNNTQPIIKKNVQFENPIKEKDNVQKHLFETILLKDYESPNVIDYPKPASFKSTNEAMDNRIKSLENERENMMPKLKPINFSDNNNNEKLENTSKLYNDILQTYNSQVNNMINHDIQNKEKENNINKILEDNIINNDHLSTPINSLLDSNINLSLNTQVNNGLNSNMNNSLNSSFNGGINSVVNDGINSITGVNLNNVNKFSKELNSGVFNEPYKNMSDITNNSRKNEFSTAFRRDDAETFINNMSSEPFQNILNNNPQTYNTSQLPSLEYGNINLKSNANDMMLDEPKFKIIERKFFLTIDSSQRDLAESPNQFSFQVKFAPAGNNYKYDSFFDSNGTLILQEKNIVFGDDTSLVVSQTFDNVKNIYCSTAIVPTNTIYYGVDKSPINVYKQPYLLLYIPELRGPYFGGITSTRTAFSKLIIDTASPTFATSFSDNIYNFTTLKSSENDESFVYNPVTLGRLDKMSILLADKYGKPYNFGIDKLYIQSFSEGSEFFNGYCGKTFTSTKITIQNINSKYSSYCSLFNPYGDCDTLNSHPVEKGDVINFYSTIPNTDQIGFFEDYIKISKMKYNKKAGNIYIYLTYTNNNGEEINVNLNGIIPISSRLSDYYLVLFNKSTNKYYYLQILSIHENYVSVYYWDTVPHFKDYNNIKVGLMKNYPRGINVESKDSLFKRDGYIVLNVGQTDETKWEIEINFPYHLLDSCNLNPLMYYPGTVFFIQQKLQITYTFKITYNVKDYEIVKSNLNDSGVY